MAHVTQMPTFHYGELDERVDYFFIGIGIIECEEAWIASLFAASFQLHGTFVRIKYQASCGVIKTPFHSGPFVIVSPERDDSPKLCHKT